MTQAENEIIEAFKRELALALRRITGRKIDLFPEELPTEVKEEGKPAATDASAVEKDNPKQEKQG
jgi:hypothetical protein